MQEVIQYIIRFLLLDNDHLVSRVGYLSEIEDISTYDVVIRKSAFFDDGVYLTMQSMPQLPLKAIESVPLLFGESKVEKLGSTLVVYADIIASTFFLISRYEELISGKDAHDEHGRMMGKKALPFRAGFIHRPIVDEYGALLRSWLKNAGNQVNEPLFQIAAVNLTHDVDSLTYYRRLRGFLGGIKRALFQKEVSLSTVFRSLFKIENDPAYTFPWLMQQDNSLSNARQFYFIKSAVKAAPLDYPQYHLRGKDFKNWVQKVQANGAQIGLHCSYFSGENAQIIIQEKQQLEKALQQPISATRWHYLRSLSPTDYEALLAAGITDDYTMGYADVAGFRLGTCRSVCWIDSKNKCVTSLVLHPLTVMDCTLSESKYMNLSEDDAFEYVKQLIAQTRQHNGELTLLWHNQVFAETNYHRSLYGRIMNYLEDLK